MKEKDKDEIMSRRQFFKRAAGVALPFLAMTMLPTALTSCEIDDDENPYAGGTGGGSVGGGGGCSTCRGTCSKNCQMACKGNVYRSSACKGNYCQSLCVSSCKGTCFGSAKGSN